MSLVLSRLSGYRYLRRSAVLAGVAGLATLQMAAFSGTAQAAPLSSVRIQNGQLQVVSAVNENNQVSLSDSAQPGWIRVRDNNTTLTKQFPCVYGLSVHTVYCPASQITDYSINTGDRADTILDGTSLPGIILAGSGSDRVSDGPGDQQIFLGGGSDVLNQGRGADIVSGGSGTDTVSYQNRTSRVRVSLNNLADDGRIGVVGEHDNILGNVENVTGGERSDILIGNQSANVLQGRGGDDLLLGNGGDDVLRGNGGNDFISGGFGLDVGNGGLGADVCTSNTEVQISC
jgi:Ca2+-binding RTX toxin-like protein